MNQRSVVGSQLPWMASLFLFIFIAIFPSLQADAFSAALPAMKNGKVVSYKLERAKGSSHASIVITVNGTKRRFNACYRGCRSAPRIATLKPEIVLGQNVSFVVVKKLGRWYIKRLDIIKKTESTRNDSLININALSPVPPVPPALPVTPAPTALPVTPVQTPHQNLVPTPSASSAPTAKPTPRIVTVVGPKIVTVGEPFELSATIEKEHGIASVDFLMNGALLAKTSGSPFKATVRINEPGVAVIQARIHDSGSESSSNSIDIVVREPSILLPLEVLGASNAALTVPFWLSAKQLSSVGDTIALEAQCFGLDYANKGKLSINGGWSLLLNNETVQMSPRKRAYGGIGGAYATVTITVQIPKKVLVVGKNAVTFEFTGTNGLSIGYRVLRFNFKNGATPIIAEDRFVYDDPDSWKPPLAAIDAIAAGKKLWNSKSLKSSSLKSATQLRAHCSDCHIDDGYDLKYFNYSNKSIIERAKFHGLTELEGAQIATYIRSLNNVNPGNPWDPPYQPGPGIDSKPVNTWAAGAGIDWVLENDAQSLPYMFPARIPQQIDLKKNFNHREVPIALELPVWNEWLPRIHPLDYWGDTFTNMLVTGSFKTLECYKFSQEVLENASKVRAPTVQDFNPWRECSAYTLHHLGNANTLGGKLPPISQVSTKDNLAKYGLVQWVMVKGWGLLRRYELEGRGAIDKASGFYYFNPPSNADPIPERNWPIYGIIFHAAPHILGLTPHGIRDETRLSTDTLSLAWYYLQMIVDSNARRGDGSTHWPYLLAFTGVNSGGFNNGSMRTISLIKMMESYYNNYLPVAGVATGWHGLLFNHIMGDVSPGSIHTYSEFKPADQIAITELLQRTFLRRTQVYTREQLKASAPQYFAATPSTDLGPHADTIYLNQRFYHVIKSLGGKNIEGRTIDKNLINEMVTFSQYLWPELYRDFQLLRK
jgi:hypothetical protein